MLQGKFRRFKSMRLRSAVALFVAAALLFATPAFPHHSNVGFEVTKVITVTGIVKGFRWANPHTWVYLTVDDGKGGKIEWSCEGRAPCVLLRAGWTPKSIAVGEKVTIDMSPSKDGSNTSLIARVTKADG